MKKYISTPAPKDAVTIAYLIDDFGVLVDLLEETGYTFIVQPSLGQIHTSQDAVDMIKENFR